MRDAVTYGLGSFGSRLVGLLLLPFYTAVLSREDFGYVDLVMTGSMLFVTLASLKLFDGAYRFLWEAKNEDEKTVLVSSALNLVLLHTLFLCALCWLLVEAAGFQRPWHAGLIVLWLSLRIPGEFFQQTARAVGKNYVYSVSGLVAAGSILLFSIVLLGYYELGVAGYLWALVLSSFLSLVYCTAAGSGFQYYRPGILSPSAVRALLRYSLPLLPAVVSWWLIRGSGRYILTHEHGLDAAGIFAVADKLPGALYMLGVTFYMAWQDAVLKHFHDPARDAFLTRAMGSYVRIGLSVVILATVLLKPFFLLMINESYHDAHVYVPWLLLAVFLMCLGGLYEVFFLGARQTLGVLWSTVVAATVSLLVSLAFTPAWGVWATTIGTVLAAAAHLAVRIVQCRDRANISFNLREIVLLLALLTAAGASYELKGWAFAACAVVTCLALGIINRSDLGTLAVLAQRRLRPASPGLRP